ncbi:aminotransferase class I/II-fold pyridoxal phosphate-dependent enzyme [Aurantibacillus circumpalustris]|uniref:aminotransferase class I/II-fold pyridoxal phosphate-dependent enzyme n=1 Tax=Aurantibacillus circumpalustris TaxID=3036359 RepID=UPI00295ACBC6|nr:8-amino-7-oxononanoate synthase [Aurantibacillus circumpalustris]
MELVNKKIQDKLQEALDKRLEASLYRSLQANDALIDFCSNDYLSFARSEKIKTAVTQTLQDFDFLSGSTGSRSISGNTVFAENLEKKIAQFHQAEAGLIFNSGYDANVGLFSCIASKGDTIICDELIHASIIDGCRLSHATRYRFAHNNLSDLEKKLTHATGTIFVAVESIYSMDGDSSDLRRISGLCDKYNANLIVDEAHATGVYGENGRGLVNHFKLENKVFARIHTFGKAMGCHGAIVLGKETLRNYLINFARSFIFTTALPASSLINISCAYHALEEVNFDNAFLHILIQRFKNNFKGVDGVYVIEGESPIQSVVIGGNEKTRRVAQQLQAAGFDVRAILSPSVPVGKERLRISLHMHNTEKQVDELCSTLTKILSS